MTSDTIQAIGHYLIVLTAIVLIGVLAAQGKVDGTAALGIIAVAAGVSGGTLASNSSPPQPTVYQPTVPASTTTVTVTPNPAGGQTQVTQVVPN